MTDVPLRALEQMRSLGDAHEKKKKKEKKSNKMRKEQVKMNTERKKKKLKEEIERKEGNVPCQQQAATSPLHSNSPRQWNMYTHMFVSIFLLARAAREMGGEIRKENDAFLHFYLIF